MFAIFVPFTESVQWKIRIIPNTRPITWQSSTMIGSIVSFSGCRRSRVIYIPVQIRNKSENDNEMDRLCPDTYTSTK